MILKDLFKYDIFLCIRKNFLNFIYNYKIKNNISKTINYYLKNRFFLYENEKEIKNSGGGI